MWRSAVAVALACLAVTAHAALLRPATTRPTSGDPSPYTPYFNSVNTALLSNSNGQANWDGAGEGLVFVDMDTLTRNSDIIANRYVPDKAMVRVVTKSLPSNDLLLFVMNRVGTNRLMVFSVSMLVALLSDSRFAGGQYDYLLGLPFTDIAANRLFYAAFVAKTIPPQCLDQIQWLIDTPERLTQFEALANTYNVTLRISIEIDVGLHRGGAANTTIMLGMLSTILAKPNVFEWSGFMGYDGHVGNDPLIPILGPDRFWEDLDQSAGLYQGFIDAAKTIVPAERFEPASANPLTFNGAGSLTISAYRNITVQPLNDYAIGSGFVKPSDFDFFTLSDISPALWLAGPILKAMGSSDCVPFVDWEWLEKHDPNEFCHGYFIDGMGLNAINVTDPPQFHSDPFYSSDSGINLLPTQGLFHTNCNVSLGVGNHVFFRPAEADIVVAFNQIVQVADDGSGTGATKVIGTWPTFRGGVTSRRV